MVTTPIFMLSMHIRVSSFRDRHVASVYQKLRVQGRVDAESRRQGLPSWSWAGWSTLAQYLESGFNADVDIGSNMIKPAEDAVSEDGRFCQYISPRPLQDLDPLSPILRSEAVMFKLRVSREEETWPKGGRAYKLVSPDDAEHCMGAIRLDKTWRDARPDLLDFILIGFSVHARGEEKSYGLKYVCIEFVDEIAYRVQLAYDPPMNESGYWTRTGDGRQSLASLPQLKLEPEEFTMITLG